MGLRYLGLYSHIPLCLEATPSRRFFKLLFVDTLRVSFRMESKCFSFIRIFGDKVGILLGKEGLFLCVRFSCLKFEFSRIY